MKILARRSGALAESLGASEAGQVDELPAMEQKTILLVEDDPSILTICSSFLREEGFIVFTASSGQQALQTCQQYPGPIHLLITDIVLAPAQLRLEKKNVRQGDMNGVQLMRQVLSCRKDIKVILMSGHSDERLESLYIIKQGVPFLRKPFSIEALVQMIHQALDGRPE
jgi:CheY-like chemotaxis protein